MPTNVYHTYIHHQLIHSYTFALYILIHSMTSYLSYSSIPPSYNRYDPHPPSLILHYTTPPHLIPHHIHPYVLTPIIHHYSLTISPPLYNIYFIRYVQSVGQLNEKMDYLYETLNGDPTMLKQHPAYLHYNLNEHIRLRSELLQAIGYTQPLHFGLEFLLYSNVKDFCKTSCISIELYEKFKIAYYNQLKTNNDNMNTKSADTTVYKANNNKRIKQSSSGSQKGQNYDPSCNTTNNNTNASTATKPSTAYTKPISGIFAARPPRLTRQQPAGTGINNKAQAVPADGTETEKVPVITYGEDINIDTIFNDLSKNIL